MRWDKGYSASYYMTIVDPATWRDVTRIRITDGQISRTDEGLRQSADIECHNYRQGIEQWIRVYMDTKQEGDSAHEALFTGLATSPEADIKGTYEVNRVTCYSVLKPAEDVYLPRGWYAPAGADGATMVKEMLNVCPAPVVVADGSPAIEDNIIAEDQETRLTMADKILQAINWRMRIDGDGTVNIEPYPIEAAVIFDPLENDVIETEIKVTADWYSCPNVFQAISGTQSATVRDEDINSPLSIQSRGREVWARETNAKLSNAESIGEYAERRLNELQRVQQTAEYDRRYIPGIYPGDIVQLHYAVLSGFFTVQSQTIELGHAARTSERIMAEVSA